MSYDIYLVAPAKPPCEACGRAYKSDQPERINPTYNLTPIFDLALTGEPLPNADVAEAAVVIFGQKTDRPRGLRVLSGRTGKDTLTALRKALGHMTDPEKREQFRALEPENGWGSLGGAVLVIRKMIAYANEYPDNVWDIH